MSKLLPGPVLALLVLILSFALAGAAGDAEAQTKAYAPQDLSVLTVPDRIRVIEKEYSEQSRGRRIPGDQLEFYLDQVESGWSFRHIQEDIELSLEGDGGWRPNPGQGPGYEPIAQEVQCESRNDRYVECPTAFRGTAIVSRQLSSTPCIEGNNFGSRPGMVWVRGGCRARFVEDDRYDAPTQSSGEIICESRNNQQRECRTNFRGRAVLARQTSGSACVEGSTWGTNRGTVWVSGGCRGIFVEARGGPGHGGGSLYSVSCNSDNGRFQSCRWDGNAGRPELLEQTSQTACIEGSTWGYDARRGLWVDGGCRGRFGARR